MKQESRKNQGRKKGAERATHALRSDDGSEALSARSHMRAAEAAAFLGVSKNIMTRLIEQNEVDWYVDPTDRRIKLVAIKDLVKLRQLGQSRLSSGTDEIPAKGAKKA